jgi:hypothetical protein
MMDRATFIESLRPALAACHKWTESHGKSCDCVDCADVRALQYMLRHVEGSFTAQVFLHRVWKPAEPMRIPHYVQP